MVTTWEDVVSFYRQVMQDKPQDPWLSAIQGIEQLASYVAAGPLGDILYPWTSMHTLCIQQTDNAPHSPGSPYLCVCAEEVGGIIYTKFTGRVMFAYVDTHIESRIWHRVVEPKDTVTRLLKFMTQLSWVAHNDPRIFMPANPAQPNRA